MLGSQSLYSTQGPWDFIFYVMTLPLTTPLTWSLILLASNAYDF